MDPTTTTRLLLTPEQVCEALGYPAPNCDAAYQKVLRYESLGLVRAREIGNGVRYHIKDVQIFAEGLRGETR